MTKLLGYYTTSIEATFKPKNPKAAYINLSLVNNWIKTTVMMNGQFISIPRWLLLDHLSIEQTLDPERRSVRDSKERLTVQPELTKLMAAKGFRYGEGMNASIPKPELNGDTGRLKFADTVREQLMRAEITHVEVVRDIMISFFKIRPRHQSDEDAAVACMDIYGWNWFEFQAAWMMYRSSEDTWIADNDPARTQHAVRSP